MPIIQKQTKNNGEIDGEVMIDIIIDQINENEFDKIIVVIGYLLLRWWNSWLVNTQKLERLKIKLWDNPINLVDTFEFNWFEIDDLTDLLGASVMLSNNSRLANEYGTHIWTA